jgi:hypothetical protein
MMGDDMKKLPIGIQTFREIIEDGWLYADKTEYVYKLINEGKCYFLSRPRRFGKSLLLSTISEVFKGNRALFDGLWIGSSDYDFKPHPVIRIDMSGVSSRDDDILAADLLHVVKQAAKEENIVIEASSCSTAFRDFISGMNKQYKEKVVVLIDEYDKPMLDRITDIPKAEANRDVLRDFYSVLKESDEHLRFIFLTGVSKFTKTSVFSGLNNLKDITMNPKYAKICGFEDTALDALFDEHLSKIAEDGNFDPETLRRRVLHWYDGYSWDGESWMLNPFSLLNFMDGGRFASYWYQSGTPKFLMDMLKKQPGIYAGIENAAISEYELEKSDLSHLPFIPLLFQTGYLTVSEMTGGRGEDPIAYRLRLPNAEVSFAFNRQIVETLTCTENSSDAAPWLIMGNAFKTGTPDGLESALTGLFASIPYPLHIEAEKYYHSIFFAFMKFLGFDVQAEVSVAGGRIDGILETPDRICVLEMKYEKCEENASTDEKRQLLEKGIADAFRQIQDKGYAAPYESSEKEVIKMAIAVTGRNDVSVRYKCEQWRGGT